MDTWCWLVQLFSHEGFKGLIVFAGVLVAIVSVATARGVARKKQAADLLFASRSDETLQSGLKHIREFHDANDKNIRSLANTESAEALCVRYVINHFETVSVGIQAGIYDETMVKKSWYSTVVQTYERTLPLINATRGNTKPTIWQEFEWLATRWRTKPLKARKPK